MSTSTSHHTARPDEETTSEDGGLFSLIVPVYKNLASLPELMAACSELARSISCRLEVVLVLDGSPDDSAAWLLANLPLQPFASQLCEHSRNFGAFAAVRTGLGLGRGEFFAVMAADLQEPISLAQSFIAKLRSGTADVTIGVREQRNDPFTTKLASTLFWGMYRKLVIPELPRGGVDMFGCTREVRDTLLTLRERNSSLVGQLFWVGYRRAEITYSRQPRRHGKSAWTFSRKFRYLLDSIYSFSDLPIKLIKWLGTATLVFVLFGVAVVVPARLLGLVDVPGYTATLLTVMFFGGLNALGLGVIGEYVWRTYENTKDRPLSISAKHRNFMGIGSPIGQGARKEPT